MADVEDYAVMVAEADWGALPYKSAAVIGIAAIFYLLSSIRVSPSQINNGHEHVFGSDTLQQTGRDATSTILKSSTTTQIPTPTVTQTVTATADPDKVASSLAKELYPVLDTHIASLKRELLAIQNQNLWIMMGALLVMFLFTSALWYFFMYKPVYNAFKEERSRNNGGRSGYTNIQTTISLPPAPEDPPNPEAPTNGEQLSGNGDLPEELADAVQLHGTGAPPEHTSVATETLKSASPGLQKSALSEELIKSEDSPGSDGSTHSEATLTAHDSPPELQPAIEDTTVAEQATPAVEDLTPSEALKNARKVIEHVFTNVQTRANKKATLHDMVESYRRYLISQQYIECFAGVYSERKAQELVETKLNEISDWIDNDLAVHEKTIAVLRKRVRDRLEAHFVSVQAPRNDAELLNYKSTYALTVLDQVKEAPNMSATHQRLSESLEMLDRLICVRSRDEMQEAIGRHYTELAAAKHAAGSSTAA